MNRALPAVGPHSFPLTPLLASPLRSWIYQDLPDPSGSFPLLCLKVLPRYHRTGRFCRRRLRWGTGVQKPRLPPLIRCMLSKGIITHTVSMFSHLTVPISKMGTTRELWSP